MNEKQYRDNLKKLIDSENIRIKELHKDMERLSKILKSLEEDLERSKYRRYEYVEKLWVEL